MTGLFFYSPLPYPSVAPLEVCLCLDGRDYVTEAAVKRRVRINNQLCGFGVSFRQSRTSKEFRAALDVADATSLRGRGRVLSQALIALPDYEDTNPAMANNARCAIRDVLAPR